MTDHPNIITSGLSKNFVIDGAPFELEIYRLEDVPGWSLEVIDEEGTSTVWDDTFETDEAAYNCLIEFIQKEGIAAFKGGKVIPFPNQGR